MIRCRGVWKVFGDRAPEAIHAIQDRQISKSQVLQEYNCVVGVSQVDLDVQKGEIFCIMGLSGSGKSTLIRMLNRLIEPSSGEIIVKGQNLLALNDKDLREIRAKHIGMVFQSVALLPHRTVLENTAFGLEVQGVCKAERNRIAAASLAKVGLADWSARYPNELSGGMQQRVGIARAITANPEIILMDEPFSALDPLIRRQLQDEFRQLSKELGKSVVFITHDLEEAMRIGDRIAIMKDGVIVQTGTAEEIVMQPANAYVAEFVEGISHLHLIKAHSVMTAVGAFQELHPEIDLAGLPSIDGEADLDSLIAVMTHAQDRAVAVKGSDYVLGIVTLENLFAAIRGKQPASEGRSPHH